MPWLVQHVRVYCVTSFFFSNWILSVLVKISGGLDGFGQRFFRNKMDWTNILLEYAVFLKLSVLREFFKRSSGADRIGPSGATGPMGNLTDRVGGASNKKKSLAK